MYGGFSCPCARVFVSWLPFPFAVGAMRRGSHVLDFLFKTKSRRWSKRSRVSRALFDLHTPHVVDNACSCVQMEARVAWLTYVDEAGPHIWHKQAVSLLEPRDPDAEEVMQERAQRAGALSLSWRHARACMRSAARSRSRLLNSARSSWGRLAQDRVLVSWRA